MVQPFDPKAADSAVGRDSGEPEKSPSSGSDSSGGRVTFSTSGQHGLFKPGDKIAERYEVLRFIARGGIGEVYEVRDLHLGERLALKMLQAHESLDEVARERFRREIQLARRVTHPNVCRLYDAALHGDAESGSQPFCTMELVGGETLQEHIEKHGSFSEDEALHVLRQMARGLEAAHAKGIIHRDFKSNNVMLEPNLPTGTSGPDSGIEGPWRVVLTDFGLARPVSDDDPTMFRTDHSGGVSGTLAFMAPEQLHDVVPSRTADIYALGVVLFHMVTGDLPFSASTPIGAMLKRLQEAPPSPRNRVPDLDRRWEAAILRCLEREPEDRFQNAGEIFEAVQGDEPTPVPSRRRERKKWIGSGLFAAAALLVIAIFWPRGGGPAPFVADDPIQLTTDPGLEIDPAISPDGKTLAYVTDQSGEFEIWLRPYPLGGAGRQLTQNGGRNVQPTWSPDGQFLAFVSQNRGGIFVLPAAGGKIRQITDFGSRPSWSPDGLHIAFQSEERKDVAERTLAAMPPSTLWWVGVNPETGQPTTSPIQLTQAGEPTGGHGEPSWSPEGQRIAFSSGNRRRSQIWSFDVETKALEPLVSEARININPLFTPDGANLIYVGISSQGRQSASYAVWRQPLHPISGKAIGDPERVTHLGIATIRQLAFSPQANSLVYTALSTLSTLNRLEVDAEGKATGATSLFTDRGQRNSRPAFSPDGTYVAFDRWSKGTNLDLWLRGPGADGEIQEWQLTFDPEWDSQAVWQEENQALTYFSERQKRRGLWTLHFDGSPTNLENAEVEFLADIGTDADWARLSPDGKKIAFHSSRDSKALDVWVRDINDSFDRRLTHDRELAGFPIWAPDGKKLGIEIRRQGSTHIAVLDLDGAEPNDGDQGIQDPGGDGPVDGANPADGDLELVQLTFEEGESWPYSFSPDGDKIAFAGRRDGRWNLYWVSLSSREVHQLTSEDSLKGYVRYPAWSPDGDHLLYEKTRTVGDLWRVDLHPPK